jgi:glucose-1-phosphate thymidylyltransferase
MKCLILAAGYATRLYPLTENFPKPLLKIGDKTILDWLVDDIDSCGLVEEFVIVSNHKFAEHFNSWAKEKPQNIIVIDDGTTSNETRLGAVCDIQLAIESLKSAGKKAADTDLLIIAGDNVLDFSLQKFIAYAKDKGTSCIMRFYEQDDEKLKKCGIVEIDEDDRIVSMEEKPQHPKSHWVCPPFYYYTSGDVELVSQAIADGCSTDAPGSFIAWLARRSKVYAMDMPGKRYDIGNIESYEQVQREYRGIKR